MTTIEIDAPPTGALSLLMQSIARNYLAARGRAGEAILDSARYLAEARHAAKYGEWKIFLETTGTQEDTATRMIAIASRAETDRQYAAAISDGRLAFTAAFELLNAPEPTQRRALESSTPTPASEIRHDKQAEKLRTSAEFLPAQTPAPFWDTLTIAHPTAHLWTQTGPSEYLAACGIKAYHALSGNTTAGHCSSCVRASWPQNQPADGKQYPFTAMVPLPDVAAYGFTARRLPDGRVGLRSEGNLETEHTADQLASLIAHWRAYPPIPADLAAAGVAWRYRQDRMYQVLCGTAIGKTGYTAAECLTNQRESMERAGLLSAPTDDQSDDEAIIAQIRAEAEALGLGVIWEDDTVILHWPDEDIDKLIGIGYTDALYWLASEGRTMAADRAAKAPASEPPAEPSDRDSYATKELRDKGRLFTARAYIASGDIAEARRALDGIEVSTWERDLLLRQIARTAALSFHNEQRARLQNFSPAAMVSQATFTSALDHIEALLNWAVLE